LILLLGGHFFALTRTNNGIRFLEKIIGGFR
jgi:hypothetical protein